MLDLTTDNNNDLVIKSGDLVLHQGEGSKLFALRNYLNTSKEAIAGKRATKKRSITIINRRRKIRAFC